VNRRTELRRGKPLQARTPLEARSVLHGGAQLARGKRLAPVSVRRQADNRERRRIAASTFEERQLCTVYELFQLDPESVPAAVIECCGRWADDVHEPLTRARGGSITDRANMTTPCRPCHEALGLEPEWGYLLKLLVHSWDAPAGDGPGTVAA
jgi:hypothetical protein